MNWQELQRQANIIDAYLAQRQISLASGLMREWVISWSMWLDGVRQRWLGYSVRKPYEQKLGGLGAIQKTDPEKLGIKLSQKQCEFGRFWNQLSDTLRNALLHHGMRQESMEDEPELLATVCRFWDRMKAGGVELPDVGGGYGRLLICSIGLTPGVLFSAIIHSKPDRVLVLCSSDSSEAIDRALAKAGHTVEVKRLLMKNAYTGIEEFESLITEASVWLFEADEVGANLTGGTTLMGALVGKLVERARREYQRRVHEFVLIDKRLPEEQRSDPWQLGEIHYLDGEPPNHTEKSKLLTNDANSE